jgi:spoIIIJ-associated protein
MSEQRLAEGQQWLEKLLRLSGIDATIGIDQPHHDRHHLWLTIDHNSLTALQVDSLIGPEGATIDAIQYLANATFPKDTDAVPFVIELNEYRRRRTAELRIIADQAAEHVRQTSQEYVMPPLSSGERRQLHAFFELEPDYADLATYSRGSEADRRLVVKLIDSPELP